MLRKLLRYEENEPEELNGKPPFHQYMKWILEQGVDISNMSIEHYERTANIVKKDFTVSLFANLIRNFCKYNNEFRMLSNGYDLWEQPQYRDWCKLLNDEGRWKQFDEDTIYSLLKKEVFTKSFSSFLLKTYRKNILENDNWDKPPDKGWILPDNWFSNINDIVRTRFTVKYFDGVEFLIRKIAQLSDDLQMKFESSFEAKDEGYYAAHIHIEKLYRVPNSLWEIKEVKIPVEIQIRTELHKLIDELSHPFYEKRRKRLKNSNTKWQWRYESREFDLYYLGHMLHYIDGKIVEVRKSTKEDL